MSEKPELKAFERRLRSAARRAAKDKDKSSKSYQEREDAIIAFREAYPKDVVTNTHIARIAEMARPQIVKILKRAKKN